MTSRRGRVRKDLFLFRAAAVASSARTGHWNLDNLKKLGLHPSARRRSMVFPTARQPKGHRQQGRPQKSPADGTTLSDASLDCSRLERKREASRDYLQISVLLYYKHRTAIRLRLGHVPRFSSTDFTSVHQLGRDVYRDFCYSCVWVCLDPRKGG